VYGLGIWPMVRPHCSSSSVRSPSNLVPVNNDESKRLQRQVDHGGQVGVITAKPFWTVDFAYGNMVK